MPSAKSIAQIKSALLHPATTSHFEVQIPMPTVLTDKYLSDNGINISNTDLSNLYLMCSEASLPGSNLATLELNNDRVGVTERHAYRRVYDDRMDFTFYVDARYYLPIRVFEIWMKYIAQESISAPEGGPKVSAVAKDYFYSFQYPDNYMIDTGLKVTKFEKSSIGGAKGFGAGALTYEFIRAFPISVSSMPVSYDSSSLLKCTVSMSYIRYIVTATDPPLGDEQKNNPSSPSVTEQSAINSAGPGFTNPAQDQSARAALGIGEFNPLLQRNISGQIINPEVIPEPLVTINDFGGVGR